MKKCSLILFFVLICSSFLKAADVTVNLSTGDCSSNLVSTTFSENNLEIVYKGTQKITVELKGAINGSVIVKSDLSDITLSLNNVTITGSELPAMQLKSEVNYTINLPKKTVNKISDSSSNGKKGAVTCSGDIIFEGSGTFNLSVMKKHGLKTDGGVIINSGIVNIVGDEKAEGNMISADTYFIMNGGNLSIEAKGCVKESESKGIKVNGVEGKGFECGYVEINDGIIDIVSFGKAITAGWKADEDGTTETLSDDPVPNVYIKGGKITVKTTGTPREDTYTNGISNNDGVSPEGIEAKNNLYLIGGSASVLTTDDCINAGNLICISGGTWYLGSTDNDALDSNGIVEISGGKTVIYSSSREQAIDCDSDNNFRFTGGMFIGLGNGNNMPKASGTSAYSVAYGGTTFKGGDHVALLDKSGKIVLGFVVPNSVTNANSIVIGSSDLCSGQSYTLAKGKFSKTSDGIITSGSFKSSSTLYTFTMSDFTVSEGYIGMNVGNGMEKPDGFGGMGGRDMMMNPGFGFEMDALLPDKIRIDGDLTVEEARQAVNYLMNKYLITDGMNGGRPNGEMPNGGIPDMRH